MKKRYMFAPGLLGGALVFLSGFNSILPAAEVSGPQSGRWTAAASPYVVIGDIVIPAGQTLNIEPGVVVKFAGYYSLKVEGTLIAIGSADNRIVFTSANDNEFGVNGSAGNIAPSLKDWKGLEFYGAGKQPSNLDHCILRYGEKAISAKFSQPTVKRLIIADCGATTFLLNGKLMPIQDGLEQDYSGETANSASSATLRLYPVASRPISPINQNPFAEQEPSFGEIKVVTVSKREQKVSDAPATVYVVTDEMIHDRGYRNLEDLLEDIPGVEIQRKSVTEYSNHIGLRGIAGNEKFIILQDGFRFNSTTGTPYVVATNYGLSNVKRVEVILGPASALYGVDAFSGIVNMITKDGEEVLGSELTGSFGNYKTTDNSFVWGKKFDELSLAVTGQFYHSDEPNFSDIYKEDYSWYNEQYARNGSMRLSPFLPNIIVNTPILPYATPTNSYLVNAKLKFGDVEVGYARNMESHSSSLGLKPEFNIHAKEAKYQVSFESIYASYTYTSLNEKWSLQSSLSKGTDVLDPSSRFINTFTSYRSGFKYAYGKTVKLEEQLSFFPSERTAIIGGVSYEDISALPKSGDLPFEFDENESPGLQQIFYIGTNIEDKSGKPLTIFQNFFNLEYKNFGSYLQLQSRLNKSFELTFGGRYDYNTRYGSSVNPRLGLVVSPGKTKKLKLLYGEAFLAPSPYKAYQHYGAFLPTTDSTGAVTGLFGPFWHLPNSGLKPEKLRSYEAAFSQHLSENVIFTIDGYYTKISDLIVFGGAPNQLFENVPIGFAEFSINKGKASIKGGTLRIETQSKIGETSVNSHAAYSYSSGDIDGEGLPFSAKHTLKAGFELKQKGFSIAPRVLYRSKSYHYILADESGHRASNKSYAVVNLFARYAFKAAAPSLQPAVFIRVNNLFNVKYYNVSFAQDEGFAATPQDPIRVTGGVTLNF